MKVSITFPKVKLNAKQFSRGKFVDFARKELLNTLARLRSQIGQGKGADGAPIKSSGYSESYRRAIRAGKVQGGTRGQGAGKSESPVNLTVSGDLLRSMQVRVVPNGAEIYFLGDHHPKLSNAGLAAALLEKGFEGWFEYGEADRQRIESELNKLIDEALKNVIETK